MHMDLGSALKALLENDCKAVRRNDWHNREIGIVNSELGIVEFNREEGHKKIIKFDSKLFTALNLNNTTWELVDPVKKAEKAQTEDKTVEEVKKRGRPRKS